MRIRLLPSLFLVRRVVRELAGIREQLTRQTDLLVRLAAQIAPQPPVATREEIAAQSGVDFLDPIDQAIVLAYVARTEQDTGRAPTDEETLSYLADEKTRDLHARLIERDQVLERIAQERS
jgi:hypothetical protein